MKMEKDVLKEVRKEVRERIATLFTAAFGFVAALAWKETIKAIFAKVFGDPDSVVAMLIYATVVTILAVVVTIVIARTLAKQE